MDIDDRGMAPPREGFDYVKMIVFEFVNLQFTYYARSPSGLAVDWFIIGTAP
jgi:hypothetical protein